MLEQFALDEHRRADSVVLQREALLALRVQRIGREVRLGWEGQHVYFVRFTSVATIASPTELQAKH